MNETCKKCSLCLECAGNAHDPAECECIENMYIEEIDGDYQEECEFKELA